MDRVVVLALPGLVTFDLGCALQVFAQPPGPPPEPALYEVTIAAPEPGEVPTADGFPVTIGHGLDTLEHADTVVVPGYSTWNEAPPRSALVALGDAARRGVRVMSICVGAFALARAGVLDGRRATTHWAVASALEAGFPEVEVVTDALYVDEGSVLTSAGLAAGLDLGLHVVRRDHGAHVAGRVARWNVVAPHREGGQAQFVPAPVHGPDHLGSIYGWVLQRLDQPLSVSELAAHACCSERTLTRRFRADTGSTPKQWINRMRLHRARELLESTELTVEQIAATTGFTTAAALRSRVAADLGTTPTTYRRAFGEARSAVADQQVTVQQPSPDRP